jgi:hypothetical protein
VTTCCHWYAFGSGKVVELGAAAVAETELGVSVGEFASGVSVLGTVVSEIGVCVKESTVGVAGNGVTGPLQAVMDNTNKSIRFFID